MYYIFGSITLLVLVGGYFAVTMHNRLEVSQQLVKKAQRFSLESPHPTTTILVLGDSTAVGVGAATSSETVPAYLAEYTGADVVENYAVSGDEIPDLAQQQKHIQRESYDYILIMIGGNDIIRFRSVDKASDELASVLQSLPTAQQTFLMPAGNVGATTFFPRLVRPVYTGLNLKYHARLSALATEYTVTYVNLYDEPEDDPFVQNPKKYLGADGLHPSSEGYKLWFEKLKDTIKE